MTSRDIIVIGASTGGIEALRTIAGGLPEDFPATLFVVFHSGPGAPGILHKILDRAGPLDAISPEDGERFLPGKIYVAPPDRHMLLEPHVICLTRGPKENRFRPAIDPLFRSAAQVYGPRAIGVILTGGLDDGTSGLWALKKLGGIAVVQDPDDALVPSMPQNALRYVSVDYRVKLVEIAPLLVRLTTVPVYEKGAYEVPEHLDMEIKIAKQDPAIEYDIRNLWEKSSYTCPDCHGVLLKYKQGNHERFRCHTGHAFTTDVLLASVTESVEESLWTAIRTIEESVMLMQHLARHLKDKDPSIAKEFLRSAQEAERQSTLVRQAVGEHEGLNIQRIEEAAASSNQK
jgi:two-component system, chemotaxis family, protein-glutamate methylesterase/glutaminase